MENIFNGWYFIFRGSPVKIKPQNLLFEAMKSDRVFVEIYAKPWL